MYTLVLSPGGLLAACTDDKGRVMLLDTHHLCFCRSWKGYRDAQCAWLEAPTLHSSGSDEEQLLWAPHTVVVQPDESKDGSKLTNVKPGTNLAPMQRCALPPCPFQETIGGQGKRRRQLVTHKACAGSRVGTWARRGHRNQSAAHTCSFMHPVEKCWKSGLRGLESAFARSSVAATVHS